MSIDHLYEATQHVRATPGTPAEHFQRGQLHALIDIAESLRKIANPPQYVYNSHTLNVSDMEAIEDLMNSHGTGLR